MALHDVDKGSHSRDDPLPNHNDQVIQSAVKAHNTDSVNYTTDAVTANTAGKNGQFTIVQVGNFTTTATYSTTNPGAGNFTADTFNLYQIAHGLSYTPSILAYEQQSSGQYAPMPYSRYQVASATQALWFTYTIYADATNVYLQLQTMTAGNASFTFSAGFIFKWYLLKQTAN